MEESLISYLVLAMSLLTNALSMGFIFGSVGVLTEQYNEMFSTTNAVSGWVGTVATGALLFGSTFASAILQKVPIRWAVLCFSIVAMLGIVITAFCTEIWQAALSFGLMTGFGVCVLHISAVAVLPLYFEKHLNFALSAQAIGSACGGLAFPFLTRELFQILTYQWAMLSLAAVISPSLLGTVLYQREMEHHKHQIRFKQTIILYLQVLKRPTMLVYFLNGVLWNIGVNITLIFYYPYIVTKMDDSFVAGLAMTIIMACVVLSTALLAISNAKLRINSYIVHIIGTAGTGLPLLCIPFTTSSLAYLLYAAMFGIFNGLTIGNLAQVARHLYGNKNLHVVYAFGQFFGGVGSFLGPPIAGAIQDQYTVESGMYFASASLFASAVIMVLLLIVKRDVLQPTADNNNIENKASTAALDINQL